MSTTTLWQILTACIITAIVGFKMLLHGADKQVTDSVTRALGPENPKSAPGSLTYGDLDLVCKDPTCDCLPDDVGSPAEAIEHSFTRAGWTQTAPGVWERDLADDECPLEEIPGCDPAFMGSVLADIDDLDREEWWA